MGECNDWNDWLALKWKWNYWTTNVPLQIHDSVFTVKPRNALLGSQKTMSITTTMTTSQALLCNSFFYHETKPLLGSNPSLCYHQTQMRNQRLALAAMDAKTRPSNSIINTKRDCKLRKIACRAVPQKPTSSDEELDGNVRRVLQILLWVAEGVYILWLFLLPYAPVGTSATVLLFFSFSFPLFHLS